MNEVESFTYSRIPNLDVPLTMFEASRLIAEPDARAAVVAQAIAVFGGNHVEPEVTATAEAMGRALVDAGFRVICGGLRGVMAAVACDARSSACWAGADVIGLAFQGR